MSNKLFSEVLNNRKPETSFVGLDEATLKALKNSAASIISRANDLEKRDRALYLKGLIQDELDKIAPKKQQAEWRDKPTDALTLEDVNKALKQAQWYKHTYGPKAKAKWQGLLKTSKDEAVITKARNFLDKCDEYYQKSLIDEEKWQAIKESMTPDNANTVKPTEKLHEVESVVAELEGMKMSKSQKELLAKLKEILSK